MNLEEITVRIEDHNMAICSPSGAIEIQGEESIKALRNFLNIYNESKPDDANHGDHLEEMVSHTLRDIGIVPSLNGYRYLIDAIKMVYSDQDLLHNMTTMLYPALADIHGTLPGRIERSIRHSVQVAWRQADDQVREQIFGKTISARKIKPTNSQFIASVTEYLRFAS